LSDPWWRRRKKKGPWFNEIYDELERLGDLIDETMQKAFDESSEKSSTKHTRVKGFSIKIGPDGKPRIQELNKRQLNEGESKMTDEIEPLIDLIEDDETLTVLAVLPGVEKEEIDLRVTETCLTVSVDAADFEWYDELKLPSKVNPKTAHASYRNGVLEVKLNKLGKVVKDKKIF